MRTGSRLTVDGATVRLAGANVYGAITTDAIIPGQLAATPAADRVAILDELAAIGHNVARAHTLFIGYGKAGTQQPAAGTYDEQVLIRCDQFLAEAAARGMWVWAPLVDSWDYYHGGAVTFANMTLGGTRSNAQAIVEFCTNPTVVTAFLAYVSTLMNRTNTATGVKWRDDPTLAVIETSNEGWQGPFTTTTNAATGGVPWHAYIARWLRANYPGKLIADGFATASTIATPGQGAVIPAHSLGNTDFDIVGTHLYDVVRNRIDWVQAEASRATAAGQVFVIGEADWRDVANGTPPIQNVETTRQEFLDFMLGDSTVDGYMWWAPQVSGRSNNTAYQLYLDGPINPDQVAARAELAAFAAGFAHPAAAAGALSDTLTDTL